jgi:hypothetical protein
LTSRSREAAHAGRQAASQPLAAALESFNGSFIKSFMILNTIIFVDIARREKERVSWDVRRVLSP